MTDVQTDEHLTVSGCPTAPFSPAKFVSLSLSCWIDPFLHLVASPLIFVGGATELQDAYGLMISGGGGEPVASGFDPPEVQGLLCVAFANSV